MISVFVKQSFMEIFREEAAKFPHLKFVCEAHGDTMIVDAQLKATGSHKVRRIITTQEWEMVARYWDTASVIREHIRMMEARLQKALWQAYTSPYVGSTHPNVEER